MMIYFFIYLVVSGVLLLLLTKGNLKEWLFKMTLVTCLPVVGWLIPSVWPAHWLKRDEQFFEEYTKKQTDDIQIELLDGTEKIRKEEELNIISVEEALLISDISTRRKIMIDILKEDALQYLDVLKTAVVNDDTETSHYAVTAVVEVKRELTLLLQKLSVDYAQNREDPAIAFAYAEIIKEYLRSGFLDAQSKRKYELTYIEILQQLIATNHATETVFCNKIEMEITLSELLAAERTALLFKQKFPLHEQAYIMTLAVHFEARAFEKFEQELQALKASPIVLSAYALKIVRYWSEGNKHYENAIRI